MIVYVETNFVLELVLLQDEHTSCEQLTALAETGQIQLVLPAYCLVEPYETLRRRHNERTELAQAAKAQVQLLGRSQSFAHLVPDAISVYRLFIESTSAEEKRLDEVRRQLLASTSLVELTAPILEKAGDARLELDLSGQDSIVYASVMGHLDENQPEAACFITRNPKDFEDPAILETLQARGCKLLSRFRDGLGYVLHCIAKT